MPNTFKQGMWCHIEIPTKNVPKSKRFYGNVFGWKFQAMPQMKYTIYETGKGGVGGGIYTPDADVPPGVLNYVFVKDIEATSAKIKKNGGHICKPKTEVPGVGCFAVVQDPEGNTFALWTSATKPRRKTARKPSARKA